MTCHEVNNLLLSYLEGIISPGEKKIIEDHLASCPICNKALADLKKAEHLVRSLEEVEPPPFFEQRIMARIREESGRKRGILWKFFLPLHVKIPIQALATFLVVILAVYVFQKNEPEMKHLTPFPPSLTESGKERMTAKAPNVPPVPSDSHPAKRAPAEDFPDKEQQEFAAPPLEEKAKTDRATDLPAPMPGGRPSVMEPGVPVIASREKEVPPAKPEVLAGAQEGAGKKEASMEGGLLPPEQKRSQQMTHTGAAAGETRAVKSSPAMTSLKTAAMKNRSAVDLTIQVRDTAMAVREIEEYLGQVNARIIERLHGEGREFLKAEIAAPKIALFLDRLEAVGQGNLDKNIPDVLDGKVTISIKIVANRSTR